MCSSIPPGMPLPPPLPDIYSTSNYASALDMFSYASTSVTNKPFVLDTKASGERDLARSLQEGLRRTTAARERIMDCIRGPAAFLLWVYAGCFLILLTLWVNQIGGFKWLQQ